MRTTSICICAAWLTIAFLVELGLADVLTTKSGGQYEGTVTNDGDGYVLVRPDGGRMTFPKEMVASVEKGPVRPAAASRPARAPGAGTNSGPSDGEEQGRIIEVVATGAGSTADEALQSAYSTAIEQVVGVLVDAETLVKNDQIVSDKIRTFSRGFVRSYDEVKRWNKDGVHYVRIRAKVAVDKLGEVLKSSKVTTREVPGDLLARQIRFDVKNEDDAAKMIEKILADFDMTKLTKVEIVGKPETKRDGANAVMKVKAQVSPDLTEWLKFAKDLRLLLDKTATKRGGLTIKTGESVAWAGNKALVNQLSGAGALVALLTSISGNKMQWNVFRVPEAMEDTIKNFAGHMGHNVAFIFLTQDGKEVLRTTEKLKSEWYDSSAPSQPIFCSRSVNLGDIWFIGPVWGYSNAPCPLFDVTTTVVLSAEDLAKVAKVEVTLERRRGRD
jgi:hypothetical protein